MLTKKALVRRNALHMVKHRAKAAGLTSKLSNRSFRATGITALIAGGGKIDRAQKLAGDGSTKTTQLYIHTHDDITLDEVER